MKILNLVSRWLGYISATAVVILMMIVVCDVAGRYFFNAPIMGASELASFMMIIIVFPPLAWAALAGSHVKVDLIVNRFSQLGQIAVNIITLFLSLGIYVVITWQSILESTASKQVTSLLRLPQSPFYWIMTACWAFFCLSIVALLIGNITKAVKK